MRILITGAKGQLGTALTEVLTGDSLELIDLPQLDLTSFSDTVDRVKKFQPELVIHCAAKTDVDDCELKPDEAYRQNVAATRNVVNACQQIQAEMVYISTDYVFDGQSDAPYREYAECNPLNFYGKTKWMGEEIVKAHLHRFYIIRTAWLFGDTGKNFVRTIINRMQAPGPLRVVDDQRGSPTYAADLVRAIERLIRTRAYGIYHITNESSCTWFEFTQLIAAAMGQNQIPIEPITTRDLNRPALRPRYSVLGKSLLSELGIALPPYQDALMRFIKRNFAANDSGR